MLPTTRMTIFSSAGSRTKNVGRAAMLSRLRIAAFFAFSVSISSQTNRPASLARAWSVKT
jgi:hypothetical protein